MMALTIDIFYTCLLMYVVFCYCTIVQYRKYKFFPPFCFKICNTSYGLVICLHVSKRFGVEPPGLIKLEKEIEQEETLSAPLPSPSPSPTKSPGKKSTGKLLDDAVSCGSYLPYAGMHLLAKPTEA